MNEGKGELTVDATSRLNCAVQPSFELSQRGSHTLQSRDRVRDETLRARLIEATVEAIADGSDPRLATSRSWL
jgi:hypothetical protein